MSIITPLSRRKTSTYSDFFKDLTENPINSDIARKIDEESVKESIKNLLMTNRGERLFQPNVGCDIRSMIFENITPDIPITITQMIRNTITSYETRCNLIDVQVTSSIDDNSVNVLIIFNLINRPETSTLTLTFDRVR
jgi:phage baseplate assembly protein W